MTGDAAALLTLSFPFSRSIQPLISNRGLFIEKPLSQKMGLAILAPQYHKHFVMRGG
jgi:hypothetical protein